MPRPSGCSPRTVSCWTRSVFQNVINQLKETISQTIYVLDDIGIVVACSELVHLGEDKSEVLNYFNDDNQTVVVGGNTYCPLGEYSKPENVIIVEGTGKEAADICNVLAVSFSSIKNLYGEKYDKISFIKNIILDNILPSDIYIKAKELHFDVDAPKAVFFIRFNEKGDFIPYDILQNMFPDKNKDYVISIGETDVVLVKEVKANCDSKELEKIAIRKKFHKDNIIIKIKWLTLFLFFQHQECQFFILLKYNG